MEASIAGTGATYNYWHQGHLRSPQYTNEEISGDDAKLEALTTSEDRERDNWAESESAINQRSTANQLAPVMGNESCTTWSGGAVKPSVILDLWTDCNDHFQRSICVKCYSVHLIPCDTYGHFIDYVTLLLWLDFGLVTMDRSLVVQFILLEGGCNVCLSFGALHNYARLVLEEWKSRHFGIVVTQSNQAWGCVFSMELNWRNTLQ